MPQAFTPAPAFVTYYIHDLQHAVSTLWSSLIATSIIHISQTGTWSKSLGNIKTEKNDESLLESLQWLNEGLESQLAWLASTNLHLMRIMCRTSSCMVSGDMQSNLLVAMTFKVLSWSNWAIKSLLATYWLSLSIQLPYGFYIPTIWIVTVVLFTALCFHSLAHSLLNVTRSRWQV